MVSVVAIITHNADRSRYIVHACVCVCVCVCFREKETDRETGGEIKSKCE